jgi:phosphohistidine phosphatase
MRVLIVRHGEAVDPYEASSDGHRWLTENGRRTLRSVAEVLVEENVRFDHVFVSPLVRAVQTAEILSLLTRFEGALVVWPALAGGTTAQALACLDEASPDATVALVGHEPLARTMSAHLTALPDYPGFRTGGVCVVDVGSAGKGRFAWAVDPMAMRRVEPRWYASLRRHRTSP